MRTGIRRRTRDATHSQLVATATRVAALVSIVVTASMLVALIISVAVTPARAAFELRMSPADQGHVGTSWSRDDREVSGLSVTTRHLRPYQIPGLRFDGFRVGTGVWSIDASQLSLDGYREKALGIGWGTEASSLWAHSDLFHRGPSGDRVPAGGVAAHGGGSLSIGGAADLGRLRISLASLDLLRFGDAGLPPRTFRTGVHVLTSDAFELHGEREWNARQTPWDRIWMVWRPAGGLGLRIGLDDRVPLSGVELGHSDLRVRAWVRVHPELNPTTGLELEFVLPFGSGPGHRKSTDSQGENSAQVASEPTVVSTPASSPAGFSRADSFGSVDWDDAPEQVELDERPWLLPDSLSVWELRREDGWSTSELPGASMRDGYVEGDSHSVVRGGADAVASTLDSLGGPTLRNGTRVHRIPLPISEVLSLDSWPGVPDSVWQWRVALLSDHLVADADRAHGSHVSRWGDLMPLSSEEAEFWRDWIPYFAPIRTGTYAPSGGVRGHSDRRPSDPTVRVETRVRSLDGVSTKRTVWSLESGVPGRWSIVGTRFERSTSPARLFLHAGGTRWGVKVDWGRVRPRSGLAVDLGRTRSAPGRMLTAELGDSRRRLRTRVGPDGMDVELAFQEWRIAASTGGLWEGEFHSGRGRVAAIRTHGDVWFLRSVHAVPLSRGKLDLLVTERITGSAATSRTDARSLAFDRRVSWSTSPAIRLGARWKKSRADGGPRFILGLPSLVAATESREFTATVVTPATSVSAKFDLRVRRTASRNDRGAVTKTTSFALRHWGGYLPPESSRDVGFEWEAGVAGTERSGRPRVHSWVGVHRDLRWGTRSSFDSGLCELLGATGSRATLDVSWSAAAPRSVPTNSRWWIGTFRSRLAKLEILLTGVVPLGVPETSGWGELRVRTELPISLSPIEDPG
ncbi:MAG: hypothetical protein H6682_01305 [Candidatus Eisenbacteria bacterium]|nr:hypothetical protein [Candidatus Eisenbacteria bacterium]